MNTDLALLIHELRSQAAAGLHRLDPEGCRRLMSEAADALVALNEEIERLRRELAAGAAKDRSGAA